MSRGRGSRILERLFPTSRKAAIARIIRELPLPWFMLPFKARLEAASRLFGTDKKAAIHNYVIHYAAVLRPVRNSPIRILEIGVDRGQSLRMWAASMPRAQVIGLDLVEVPINDPRVITLVCDQGDAQQLEEMASQYAPFDVVIDDGSHRSAHILTSHEVLWPHLKPGGWYVIEDLACAYNPMFGGGPPGTVSTSAELVKGFVDEIHAAYHSQREGGVAELRVYDEIAFIRKA